MYLSHIIYYPLKIRNKILVALIESVLEIKFIIKFFFGCKYGVMRRKFVQIVITHSFLVLWGLTYHEMV